jgi:hypothetical protein
MRALIAVALLAACTSAEDDARLSVEIHEPTTCIGWERATKCERACQDVATVGTSSSCQVTVERTGQPVLHAICELGYVEYEGRDGCCVVFTEDSGWDVRFLECE